MKTFFAVFFAILAAAAVLGGISWFQHQQAVKVENDSKMKKIALDNMKIVRAYKDNLDVGVPLTDDDYFMAEIATAQAAYTTQINNFSSYERQDYGEFITNSESILKAAKQHKLGEKYWDEHQKALTAARDKLAAQNK